MMPKPSASQLRLKLLGPPQIHQGHDILVIPRRKAQALLYYVVVTGAWHRRASLAALLWPDSDQQQAQGALRRHLSELNKALGGGRLETGQDTVRLARPTELWVDVHEFRQLLAKCQELDSTHDEDPARCIELLTAAVSLYQADFLAGFSLPDAPGFDEWQSFQTEELRLAYGAALEQLVAALSAQGKAAGAIAYARRWLSLDPLHEPAHRHVMRLYAATGQPAVALQQYQVCAQTLRAELDVLPAPETTELYEQIRQGQFAVTVKPPRTELATSPSVFHNLPAPTTPFVGRSMELTEVIRLCRDPARRIITILGPGGIGKTRLSLEVAAQLVDEMPHGVFFVRLAQLSDPVNIIPTSPDPRFPVPSRWSCGHTTAVCLLAAKATAIGAGQL